MMHRRTLKLKGLPMRERLRAFLTGALNYDSRECRSVEEETWSEDCPRCQKRDAIDNIERADVG